jgi:hypothetical protein
MKGRRSGYLNPIRMYLFTSAIFFIFISSFVSHHAESHAAVVLRDSMENADNYMYDGFSIYGRKLPGGELVNGFRFPHRYAVNGVKVYDSLQRAYEPRNRDNVYEHFIYRRFAAAATAYHKDPSRFVNSFYERLGHSFSKVFFLSLPLFALLLQLLYIRHKKYYFNVHAVFALHFYCVIFLFLLIFYILYYLVDPGAHASRVWITDYAAYIVMAGLFVYLLVAMQRFYKQPWYKTAPKFLVQSIFLFIVVSILSVMVFLNSMLSLSEG